jgi:L-ornithine Nalpha-acyltransferase
LPQVRTTNHRRARQEIIMNQITCRIAETRKELDDALRIRHVVFAQELENLDPVRHAVPREVDAFDTPETTIHFVAYLDDTAVGAARMIRPNREIASATGTLFGFDIESKFDLTNLAQKNIRLAETMRYCVIAGARQKPVASIMVREAARISRELGITHWIGSATIETSVAEDAARIESTGANLGLMHREIRITPRKATCPFNVPQSNTLEQSGCRLSRIPASNADFPRVLSMYSKRLGARIIGPPAYDARFRGYSIPILMAVADQRITDDRPHPGATTTPLAA